MKLHSVLYAFGIFIPTLVDLVNSQISTSIVYLDKSHEHEPFYFDLSFLNSNFSNHESVQNKFSTRERNGMPSHKHSCNQIKQIPSSIRIDLKLSYFYQKYTEAYGIPIVGSNKVTSNGLKRACYVLRFYLANNFEIREAFYKKNFRILVLATSENLLNVPEYNQLPSSWNSLRGLSPTLNIPLLTVSEENLLCSNDKFRSEDLIVHELSYALMSLDVLNSDLKTYLNGAYQQAHQNVPWKNSFSLVDIKEYLASGIDAFLNSYGKKESFLFTIDDLKIHDPHLLYVLQKIFPCDNIYLNKCKSTREMEATQNLKLGNSCELEISGVPVLTAKTTTSVYQSDKSPKNDYTQRHFSSTIPTTKTSTLISSSRLINRIFDPTQVQTTSKTKHISTTTHPILVKSNECENSNENCESWALKGECNRNRQYMSLECKKSCGYCEEKTTTRSTIKSESTKIDISVFENLCKDDFAHCPVFALRGDCKLNPHYMLLRCMRSCNLCGDLVDQKDRIQPSSKKPSFRRPIMAATQPVSSSKFRENIYSRPVTEPYRYQTTSVIKQNSKNDSDCKDLVNYCGELAGRGDCVSNEATMKYYCPVTCNLCQNQ
ncbi:unnamed protein product [Brachionus calyciflorus]|uniref:ShKT domain-containing protein n=1 Tax=Brachionus calyciflorus TaxID=104777 RepID=A0A814GHC0_9BILA|nr:unnamed protein product [Brachionus calyciflorus]